MVTMAVIGPPGAGKGTQSRTLCDRFDMELVSTGVLFRQALYDGTALGLSARKHMDSNELVPDELVDAIVEEKVRMVSAERGIMFDGSPRTTVQARWIDDLLRDVDRQLELVVYVFVPDDDIVERLRGRLACRQCEATYHELTRPPSTPGVCGRCTGELYRRMDDEGQVVRARLRTFRRNIDPVLRLYEGDGRLIVVDGCLPVDDLSGELAALVEATQLGQHPSTTRVIPLVETSLEMIADVVAGIVLLGGPGSGKGTQAVHIAQALGVPHISSGDLFRENLKAQTDLGRLAKTYMEAGELVPDEVTEEMVRTRLCEPDAEGGFVLDGFPRSRAQAEALEEMLTQTGRQLAGVLDVGVSDDEIVRRLSGRLTCRNCQASYHTEFKAPAEDGTCDVCGGALYRRDDDDPATIRARLRTFHGNAAPLAGFYDERGLLVSLDGEGDQAEVTKRVLASAHDIAGRSKLTSGS